VLIKGIKGQFEPVIGLFNDILSNCSHLVALLKEDKTGKSINFSLSVKEFLLTQSQSVQEFYRRVTKWLSWRSLFTLDFSLKWWTLT